MRIISNNSDSDSNVKADSDARARTLGYLLVVFLIFVMGGWAVLAPLESAALATGVVQVEGKRKLIQHLEGGIVSKILVGSGDRVEEDQPLLLLDAARYRADRAILEGRLFNTRAVLERLLAERDDKDRIDFSDQLSVASETDPRAENAINSEQALFTARLADRKGEEEVIQSQREGFGLIAESKREILSSIDDEIIDLTELLADGYVDRQRLRELERSRAQLLGELSDLNVSIDEAELSILQIRKRFKTQVVQELTEVQEELHDLQEEYAAADDRVVRSTIRSPAQGSVINLKVNTIGAVVGSGEILMEIVPDILDLVVEARISPMDIDRVKIGQAAEVRFSVFKDAYMISGVLTKLSADRLLDESGDFAYYEGEIKLLEEDLHLLQGMAIIPGMPAEVLIKTGERTMMGYLMSPMARIASRSLIED